MTTQNTPQITNYVICQETYNPKLSDFISNNVGKCVLTKSETSEYTNFENNNWTNLYLIQYDGIPVELQLYFRRNENEIPYIYKNNSRFFEQHNILFWSSNKEDCKLFIHKKI